MATAASLDCIQYSSRQVSRLLVAGARRCKRNRGAVESTGAWSKGTRMTGEKSLRLLVEKWLPPTVASSVRVIRLGRTGSDRSRYVRIEALRPDGPAALFFFQHDDGAWRVFPPATGRLTIRAYASAV